MSVIRNPNYVEGQPVGYWGWWQFSDRTEAVYGRLDPATKKPVEPRCLSGEVDYMRGTFLGWVENWENYEAWLCRRPGREGAERGPWAGFRRITPDDLENFREISSAPQEGRELLSREQAVTECEIRLGTLMESGLILPISESGRPSGEPSSLPPHPQCPIGEGPLPRPQTFQEDGSMRDPNEIPTSEWMRETLERIFDQLFKYDRGGVKKLNFLAELRQLADEFRGMTSKLPG